MRDADLAPTPGNTRSAWIKASKAWALDFCMAFE